MMSDPLSISVFLKYLDRRVFSRAQNTGFCFYDFFGDSMCALHVYYFIKAFHSSFFHFFAHLILYFSLYWLSGSTRLCEWDCDDSFITTILIYSNSSTPCLMLLLSFTRGKSFSILVFSLLSLLCVLCAFFYVQIFDSIFGNWFNFFVNSILSFVRIVI